MQQPLNNSYYCSAQIPISNSRSISPIPTTKAYMNNYSVNSENFKTPETELKVTKNYRSVTPTPVANYSRNESNASLIIENLNPGTFRLQKLGQNKNLLYEDLKQMMQDNRNLNMKLQNLNFNYHEDSKYNSYKDTLMKELMRIKEILEKFDFRNGFSNGNFIQSEDFSTIQLIITNISNNLKVFEENLFKLWDQTEKLGKEVIEWQNYCTHQDAVYNIRIHDLTIKIQQMMNEAPKKTSIITVNDFEYKNKIKELEKRANDLEVCILSAKKEKEWFSKELNDKTKVGNDLYESLKTNKRESDEKILHITSQLEKVIKILDEKNEYIENLQKENIEKIKKGGAPNENHAFIQLEQENKDLSKKHLIKTKEYNDLKMDLDFEKKDKYDLFVQFQNLEKEFSVFKEATRKNNEEKMTFDKYLNENHDISNKKIEELLAHNQELQKIIDKLYFDEKNYKKALEEMRKSTNDLREKYKAIERELSEEIDKTRFKNETEKNQAQNEIHELKEKIRELLVYISKMENGEKEHLVTIENLERQLVEWKEKYETLQNDYNEEIEEIRITYDEEKTTGLIDLEIKYKAELEVRNTKIQQLEIYKEECESKIRHLTLENQDLDKHVLRIKDELIKFNWKVEETEDISRKKQEKLEQECEKLKRKIQEYQEKEIKETSEKKSLDLILNQLKEELESKQKENEKLYDIVENRNSELEDVKKDHRGLKEENIQYKTQIKAIKMVAIARDEQISELKKELYEANITIEKYLLNSKTLNEEVTHKNLELQRTIEELDSAKYEYEKALKEISIGGSPNKRSSISRKSVSRSSLMKVQILTEETPKKELNENGLISSLIIEEDESEKVQE